MDLLEKSEFIKGLQKELEKEQIAHQQELDKLNNMKESYVKMQQDYDTKVDEINKYQVHYFNVMVQ